MSGRFYLGKIKILIYKQVYEMPVKILYPNKTDPKDKIFEQVPHCRYLDTKYH
jgi:hypothetical protein